MNPAAFRKLALALPGAVEGEHHGHPDFRAGGRVFASLYPDGERAMVRVPVPLQQHLVAADADAFKAAAGAWGRAGCTEVRLDAADVARVRDALAEAWQFAAAGAASSASKKNASKARKASASTASATKAKKASGASQAKQRAVRAPKRTVNPPRGR